MPKAGTGPSQWHSISKMVFDYNDPNQKILKPNSSFKTLE